MRRAQPSRAAGGRQAIPDARSVTQVRQFRNADPAGATLRQVSSFKVERQRFGAQPAAPPVAGGRNRLRNRPSRRPGRAYVASAWSGRNPGRLSAVGARSAGPWRRSPRPTLCTWSRHAPPFLGEAGKLKLAINDRRVKEELAHLAERPTPVQR